MAALPIIYEGRLKGRYRVYLYRIVDERGRVWYVGITDAPYSRSKVHGAPSTDSYVARRIREHGIGKFKMIVYGGSQCGVRIRTREIKEMVRLKTYKHMFPDNPIACNKRMIAANHLHDLSPRERRNYDRRQKRKREKKREQGWRNHNARTVRFAGHEFLSLHEAAEFAQVGRAKMARWIADGVNDFPEGFKPRKYMPCTWQGKRYPTRNKAVWAAHKKTGIPRGTLSGWIGRGLEDVPADYEPNPSYEVTWRGKVYPLVKLAAQAAGVEECTMRKWVRLGYTDYPPEYKPAQETTWRGKKYPTLSAAAKVARVGVDTMSRWAEQGFTDYPPHYERKPYRRQIVWEGKKYPSMKSAARENGISYIRLRAYVKKGYSTLPEPHVSETEWQGTIHVTVNAAAIAAGVPFHTMNRWRKKGITDFPPSYSSYRPDRTLKWEGKEYPNVVEIHKATGIGKNSLYAWINAGLTAPPADYRPRSR